MADRCIQCGAELLTNMRFCRFCGASTGPLSPEETATQQFPSAPAAPQQASATRPVYVPPDRPVAYPAAPLEPPRKRWPWVLGFFMAFVLLILGVTAAGVIYVVRRAPRALEKIEGVEVQQDGDRFIIRKDGRQIAVINGERGGSQDGDAITRTIPLPAGGTFALATDIGDVEITTWDRDDISIEAHKHLGSRGDRRRLDVEIDTSAPDAVTVRTQRPEKSNAHLDYKIKLPRHVNNIQINTARGDVKIDGVQGHINVGIVNGDIDLENVEGGVEAQTTSGDISLRVKQGAEAEDINLESVNGDLDARFIKPFNADVEVSTTNGDINVRGGIQLAIEKRVANKSAQGHIGQGGGPKVRLRTVNGDIQLTH